MIPRIIHQTWKDRDPPLSIYPREWIASWRLHNPDWEYRFWTDLDLVNLVAAKFPRALERFLQVPGVMKADFGRYLLLYWHGGVYVDLDYECLRPLESLRQRELLLSWDDDEERWVNNALMGSVRRHPLFKIACLETLKRMVGAGETPVVHDVTGPGALTDCLTTAGVSSAHVLPAAMLCPLSWKRQEWISYGGIRYEEIPRLREECRAKGAYAVTYWTGVWDENRAPK